MEVEGMACGKTMAFLLAFLKQDLGRSFRCWEESFLLANIFRHLESEHHPASGLAGPRGGKVWGTLRGEHLITDKTLPSAEPQHGKEPELHRITSIMNYWSITFKDRILLKLIIQKHYSRRSDFNRACRPGWRVRTHPDIGRLGFSAPEGSSPDPLGFLGDADPAKG